MLKILYEDNDIIVCVKPVGTASQAERSTSPDMVSILMNYFKESGNPKPYAGVIHRLDKPVSGVMVYGKTKKAAATLSAQLQNHIFSKSYKAVICSESKLPVSEQYITLKDYLIRDGRTNTSRVCDPSLPDSKEAVLEYRVLSTEISDESFIKLSTDISEKYKYLSLVDINLITGRHHQIRVQFSSRNMPLWGDTRYSSLNYGRTSVALCAYRLTFNHPVTGKRMDFVIEPENSIFPYFHRIHF